MPGEVVDFDIVPFFRSQKTVIGSFCYTREEVAGLPRPGGAGLVRPLVTRPSAWRTRAPTS